MCLFIYFLKKNIKKNYISVGKMITNHRTGALFSGPERWVG